MKPRSLARLLTDEEKLKRTLTFLDTRPRYLDGQRRKNAEGRLRAVQRRISESLQLLIPLS